MCIDAKEAKKIADNAVLNQNAMVNNEIAKKVLDASNEKKKKKTFEFSYPLLFKWEFIKKYLTEKGYQISANITDDTFSFSVMWNK